MNPEKIKAVFLQTAGVEPSADELKAISQTAQAWGVKDGDAGMLLIVQNRAMQYALGSMPERIARATSALAVKAGEAATNEARAQVVNEVAKLVPGVRDELAKALAAKTQRLNAWAISSMVIVVTGALLAVGASAYKHGVEAQSARDIGTAGILARFEASSTATRAAAQLEAANPGLMVKLATCDNSEFKTFRSGGRAACRSASDSGWWLPGR